MLYVLCHVERLPLRISSLSKVKIKIAINVFLLKKLGHDVHCNGHNKLYEICAFFLLTFTIS